MKREQGIAGGGGGGGVCVGVCVGGGGLNLPFYFKFCVGWLNVPSHFENFHTKNSQETRLLFSDWANFF